MPQVITTILLDDNPKGLRLFEIAGWVGKSFVIPRSKLKAARDREELLQPGLYFLFGEIEKKPQVYIGQSENVLYRLSSHAQNRPDDEWSHGLVFVGGLDNTFIKYLESVAIDQVKRAERYEMLNGVSPRGNTLSESQKIVAEDYFQKVKLLTGVAGYLLFDDPDEQKEDSGWYYLKSDSAEAIGRILDTQEFLVQKGAILRKRETPAFEGTFSSRLRLELLETGKLMSRDDHAYELLEDYIFTSPSAAGATITGRAINGWTAWKDQDGKTLDENVRG